MLLDTQGDPVETFSYPLSEHLRSLALALPETGEGTSCVNRAFRVRKKNFLFVGEEAGQVRIMLKLTGSLEAASAKDDPRVDVGKFGWVTLRFAPDDALEQDVLAARMLESFRALAPATVIRLLDARDV